MYHLERDEEEEEEEEATRDNWSDFKENETMRKSLGVQWMRFFFTKLSNRANFVALRDANQ